MFLDISKASLHVIKFPSGKFGYVGKVPTEVCSVVPSDKHARMHGRAFTDKNGDSVMYKSPVFDSEEEAVTFASEKGFTAKTPMKG